jgi:AcrR family transcriptional regulator
MVTAPATRKTQATFARLVMAAREGMRRDGSISPEAVAEIADLSPATLYAYFGSKDVLLAAAFDAALGEIAEAIAPILSIERLLERGWDSTARALVRTVVKGFSHDGRLVRLAISKLGDSPEVLEVYNRRTEEQLEQLRRFIRLGASAGQLRSADASVLARTALLLLQSLQNPLALRPGSGPVVEEMSRAVRDLLAVDS